MNKLLIITFAGLLLTHLKGIVSEVHMYTIKRSPGFHVELECEALDEVDCSWKYNDKTLNIDQQYEYLFSNGVETADCSIEIHSFYEDHFGNWTCWSLSNDEVDGDLLASYTLTTSLPYSDDHLVIAVPGSISSQIGRSVSIPCKSRFLVYDCEWLRNDMPVNIINRYKYIDTNVSDFDCSMNITSVQNIDIGTWQCIIFGHIINRYVVSPVGQLTLFGVQNYTSTNVYGDGNNTIVEQPRNSTVHIGDTVVLSCRFRESVRCVWHHNYMYQDIDFYGNGRYEYTTYTQADDKTTDCSLRITNSQIFDQGQWRCVSAGDDRNQAISSNDAFISFIKDEVAVIVDPPKDVIAQYQNNVSFICRFNTTVNCDWRREGISVTISGRYSYSSAEHGKNTTDCTIQIQSVNEVDVGNWSCGRMLNFTNTYLETVEKSCIPGHAVYAETPSPPKILITGIDMRPYSFVHLKDSPALANVEVVCVSENGNPPPRLSLHTETATGPAVTIPGNHELEMVGIHLYTAKLRSNITSFPKRKLIILHCEVDHLNHTGHDAWASIFIGERGNEPLNIVEGPKSAILSVRDPVPVNLTCKFNRPVHCKWERDGLVEHNFKFVDGSNGLNTSDCTVILNPTTLAEILNSIGKWQCFGHIDSDDQLLGSNEAFLSMMKKPTLPVIRYHDSYVVNNHVFIYYNLLPICLYCKSFDGNPAPKLHWELDGNHFEPSMSNVRFDSSHGLESYEISVDVDRSQLVKNSTSLKCVLNHPSYPEPKIAEVMLKKHRKPFDPIIAVNDSFTKTDITVLTNTSTEIRCESHNGYPAANLFWELDGQRIPGVSEISSSGNNLSTVILQWPDLNWTKYRQPSMDLKCVAQHPEYEKSHFAQAMVKFVVINKPRTRDLIILKNDGTAVKAGTSFTFRCQYSEKITCGMKLTNVLVDDIRFVPSFHSFDKDDANREIDICNITLPRFDKRYVGQWQCICFLTSDNTTVDSNPIWLSLMRSPLGPEIRMNNKVITEVILKYPDEIPDLTCLAKHGNPAASLRWVLDGVVVDNREELIVLGNDSYSKVLSWNSIISMPLDGNSVILQCLARHPNYDVIYMITEIVVTLQKAPDDPKILLYQRQFVVPFLNISMNDLDGLKCICENGNPAATLTWQVNSVPLSSTVSTHRKKAGLFSTELRWNSTNNQFLTQGTASAAQIVCSASHPNFRKNRTAVLNTFLDNSEKADGSQSDAGSNTYWIGIAITPVLLILIAVTAILYSRFRRRSSHMEDPSVINRIRRLLPSCLGRFKQNEEEHAMQYSNLEVN